MSSYRVKLRRGTTAETSVFTGEVGEVTVDTTKKTLVVHDGATRGGHPLPRDTDVKTDLNQLTDNYGLLQSYVDGFTGSTEVYAITVAPDSSGNNNVFYITGLENPHIVLTPGNRYVFDVSDSSNTGHPLYFTADDGVTNYTTNVSRIGTEGTAGAKVIFIIPADVPALKYYCSVHGLSMGNQISSVLNTPQSSGGGSSSLASFDISPALPTGETSWNLATDGDLSITEAGNWTFTATADGTVDLSMKGAGGGYGKDTNALGGTGGLTSGKIAVTAGEVFKVTVGSKGVQSGGAGAYGGGGAGGNLTLPGSGGGYSGIFEGNEQQSKSILIAGGGGGGHGWDVGSATGNGGSGGGADGTAGTAGSSGGGATQIGGGAGAGNGTSGTPLTGGTGGTRSTNQGSGGGGGGGYFGGGGGAAGTYNGNQNGTPGGGGSGYIGGTSNFAVIDGVTTAGSGSTTEVDGTFSMVGQVATTEETPTVTTPTVISDSYETIFHLTTDGAAGVNTEFADSSSTAATITAGGSSVQLSTFSPYRHGGYSTYFDGSGDYITIPNNSGTPFDFGTDNFTIEGWFYLTTSGSWTSYWGISQGGGPAQKINLYDSAGDGTLDIDVDGSVVFSSSAVLTDLQNKWAHIALVREGTGTNQTKLYVNGSVVGQGTVSTNFSGFTQPFTIGHNGEIYSGAFNGYISDFRIVSSAVYTADFTPPTERLTAISGTELLTCHLPYIADGSTNSNTITITGNTKTEPFSPYDRVGYNEDLHGGSVYFDQTGVSHATVSRLQVGSASPDYDLSSGGTVEGWVYLNSYGNNSFPNENRPLWCFYNTSYNGVTKYYSLNVDSTGYLAIKKDYNGHTMTVSTTEIPLNVWVHVAFTTTGTNGTNKFYVNGKDVTSSFAGDTTLGGYFPGSTGNNDYELWVGAIKYAYNGKDYIAGMDGYISDLRVFKGDVLYSGDFTPPTALLESTDTAAHIKGVEGHIIDKAQSDNKLTLVGNTTASTAESKYAGSSIYFDGSGDYLTIPTTAGLSMGTGDFTVESWFNTLNSTYSTNGSSQTLFAIREQTGGAPVAGVIRIFISGSSGKLGLALAGVVTTSSTVINANQWYHIAVVRSGTQVDVYLDGVSVINVTEGANLVSLQPTLIGAAEEGDRGSWDGYIEDFRITKGVARYTEDFTVPSESLDLYTETSGTTEETPTTYNILSNSSNTGLLITTDGEAGGNSSFVDSSSNAATITAGDTPQLNTFSPYRHGGYSTYFDGSSEMRMPADLSGIGTGDFTMECWIKTGVKTNYQSIMGCFTGTSPGSDIGPWLHTNNVGVILGSDYDMAYASGSTDVCDNNWHHIALVRSSGTITIYVDGTADGTLSHNQDLSTLTSDIVLGDLDGYNRSFTGSIADARITTSALYTEAFTPPTERLAAVDGTESLTCNLPYFADSSSNSATITTTGNVSSEPFSPYDHIGYIEATNGGSVYFDGTEWLQVGHNSIYDIYGSADGFTVEGWIYPEQWANTEYGDGIVCKNTSNSGWIVRIGQDGKLQFVHPALAGSGPLGVPCPINTWTHFAFTRTSAGDWNLYQNGVNTQTFTLSGTTNRDTSNDIYIGREVSQPSAYFKGYISDVKISNTVLYSTDFAAPTSVMESTDSLLHIKGVEGHIIDKAQSGIVLELGGNVAAATGTEKYSTSNIVFDGSGDYIRIPYSDSIMRWWDDDYTMEYWIRPSAFGESAPADSKTNFMTHGDIGGTTDYWSMGPRANGTVEWFWWSGAINRFSTTNALSVGTWHHLAFTYEKATNTATIYVDGVESASATVSNTPLVNSAYPLNIGHGPNGAAFDGRIEDFRISNRLVYTEDFTVPNAALESPQTTGGGSYTSTSYRYMKVVLNSVSSGTQAQVTEISFTGENGATDFITGQTITNWYGTGSTATSQSPTIALVNNAQSPQNSEHTNLETLPFTLEYDLGTSYVHGTELRYLQLGSSDSAYRYPTSVTVYGATQPDFSDEVALITNSAQAYASVNSNTLIDLVTSIPATTTPGDWNFDEAAGTDINSYSTWSAFSLPQLSGSPSWTFNGSALVVDLGGEYDVGISTPMNVTSGTTYTITINLSQNSVSRSGIMIGTSAGDQTYANALGGEITSSGEHVRTWTATTTGTVYFLYRSVAANVTSGTMTIDNITISPWE